MARGPRKSIEEKIMEKEELIAGLQARIKSEQKELETLHREKRNEDLTGLNDLLTASGLSMEEASKVLQEYIDIKELQTA